MRQIIKFFKEAKSELNKVVWPSWDEITRSTFVVFVAIIIITLMVYGMDTVINTVVVGVLG